MPDQFTVITPNNQHCHRGAKVMTAHVDETDGDGDATLQKKSAFKKSPFFRALASKKSRDDDDVESQLEETANRLLAELAVEIETSKNMRLILQGTSVLPRLR